MNNTGLAATTPNVIVNDSCEIEVESAAERLVNIVGYSVIILVSHYRQHSADMCSETKQSTQHHYIPSNCKHGCRRYTGYGP